MNNAFLQDKELPVMTKGILATILSNREDWEVYPEEIAKRLGLSRTTIDKHLKIMAELRYMTVEKVSLGRGKGTKIIRKFSDVPFPP